MPYPKQDRNKRFWEKVDKNGPIMSHMTTRCWVWVAAKFPPLGYGAFQDEGRAQRAHRVSYAMQFGTFPRELDVLHHCDNPACVRPDHLFLGTQVDNNEDRDMKGRQAKGLRHGSRTHPERVPRGRRHGWVKHPDSVPRGSTHGCAKLTDEEVAAIREAYIPYKMSYAVLGKKFGVHPDTIRRVVREISYKQSTVV